MSEFDKAVFFKSVRSGILGPTLDANEAAGCEAIIDAAHAAGHPLSWCAYELATAYHETGSNMSPNVESLNYTVDGLLATFGRHRISVADANRYGRTKTQPANQEAICNIIYGGAWGKKNLGNTQPGDGFLYRGRGMDHVTGRANYAKVDAEIGLNGQLVANPDLLLAPDLAAKCMVSGMQRGRYRGHKLADFLPRTGPAKLEQFIPARAIINPDANGKMIARHALRFQDALIAGGYR